MTNENHDETHRSDPTPAPNGPGLAPGQRPPDPVGDLATKALLARPGISLRVRLIMGFSVIFVVALAVVILSWFFITRTDDKLEFVERADKFANEIQQCRRYEKNFLLYGSGNVQLLQHLDTARRNLFEVKVELSRVIGADRLKRLERHLEAYTRMIYRMLERHHQPKASPDATRKKFESELREHGARLVQTALVLAREERHDVRRNLSFIRRATLVILAIFLVVMIIVANFMARHLLTRLRYLNGILKRVGAGDFSPILPIRKYRDEFTSLAVTMNRMMEELVSRQEQLVQARKIAAVGTLTAGIAHEINNPVNNISLVLESLIDDRGKIDEAERRRLLQEAMDQSDRVAEIVKNLLEFSRSNHPRMGQVSLEGLVDTVARLIKNEMKFCEVELTKEVRAELPEIYADKGGLQQVFINLFLNGVQAMPNGGKMTVTIDRVAQTNEARIDVTDTGIGISSENLEHIFDPFFTTKPESEGTGLGLSVSYSIVDKHGGRIEVRSQPGLGTTFTVFLPLDTPQD